MSKSQDAQVKGVAREREDKKRQKKEQSVWQWRAVGVVNSHGGNKSVQDTTNRTHTCRGLLGYWLSSLE